ncbi:MAG: 2'-5' RNA ligase family protein [Candidatus Aenigmarchaeota archaeon]|nr:2'-5' RNA ligase family protein [Candidatus Aenigmarchaeota archaeon]
MRPEQSYSIWLVPKGDVNKRLSVIINELSEKHNSPRFIPHVGLVGGFTGDEGDLISKTKSLSEKLRPFNVMLTDVSRRDEFFRSLFIMVEKTPEFMAAYGAARAMFNCYGELYDPEKYMPHLSLIYASLDDKTKDDIMEKTGRNFNIPFEADSIHLFHSNERDKIWTEIKEFTLK